MKTAPKERTAKDETRLFKIIIRTSQDNAFMSYIFCHESRCIWETGTEREQASASVRLAGGKWIPIWTDCKEKGTKSHTETQMCANTGRAADLFSVAALGWLENREGYANVKPVVSMELAYCSWKTSILVLMIQISLNLYKIEQLD